ncbi:halocyanin domain-containing protein [Halonotius terrestris]|uniref:Halocyanin domain-containing protein n=1 Tax=Halonotius terrestris TaxID=2487750 RepID=A0A8J8PCH0_9EURY|nr:halocyanin domain-containing protein [Halonotius terrestris]TQQ82662.1 halocyanin domain-containing protein [Halonotius terrestris]
MDYTRRHAVAAAGSAVTLGLAGCLGGGGGDAPYDGHLGPANNFDGVVVDRTGENEVTVAVGANSGLSFDPAAVKVSPGTTVVWKWTGRGGQHNVIADDGSFESDYYLEDSGQFSYTFETPGVYKYRCTPHQTQGMLGVVEVVEA